MANDTKTPTITLSTLRPARGSSQNRKRVGRGPGSGLGKTSGKGHKGHKARTGGYTNPGFEGGQTPLYRRIPKRGFTNIFRTEFAVLNVASLNGFSSGEVVTPELLHERGLVRQASRPVKILGEGDLKAALTVRAHAFSRSAEEKITRAGGRVERLS